MVLICRKAAIKIRLFVDQCFRGMNMSGLWQEKKSGKMVRAVKTTRPSPMVGIFWFIEAGDDRNIIYDAVDALQGEKYNDALGYGEHYFFWEKLAPKTPAEVMLKDSAYDAYPRGRIVFTPKKKMYFLYRDKCIAKSDLCLIMETFRIAGADVEIRTDAHYRCAQCNRFFINI